MDPDGVQEGEAEKLSTHQFSFVLIVFIQQTPPRDLHARTEVKVERLGSLRQLPKKLLAMDGSLAILHR
jgi:hypothetical protein